MVGNELRARPALQAHLEDLRRTSDSFDADDFPDRIQSQLVRVKAAIHRASVVHGSRDVAGMPLLGDAIGRLAGELASALGWAVTIRQGDAEIASFPATAWPATIDALADSGSLLVDVDEMARHWRGTPSPLWSWFEAIQNMTDQAIYDVRAAESRSRLISHDYRAEASLTMCLASAVSAVTWLNDEAVALSAP